MAGSHDEYKSRLIDFAQTVPKLLTRSVSTADLALDFQSLRLEDQFNRKFTLAVIGRMRSGKSTLLNALLGEHLAPVDVNETTATVNWIDHGPGDKLKTFEVYWKNQAQDPETRPLADVEHFVGRSELAAATDHLQFYASSDFLRNVRLIDTPGSDSVEDSHEDVIQEYLRRKSGERADAIVVVLGQKAGASDRELLDQFSRQSRLPGQTPYNTVAVLQKWETFDVEAPEVEAQRVALEYKKNLAGKVTEVLPVSGLLALAARNVPVALLDELTRLAGAGQEPVQALRQREKTFREREPGGVPLDAGRRNALFEQIAQALSGGQPQKAQGTWPMIRFALGLAQRRSIGNGSELAAQLREISQIDQFQQLLHRRIFARQQLIRAGTVLASALEPCRAAVFHLKNHHERRRDLLRLGEEVNSRVSTQAGLDATLAQAVSGYIIESQRAIAADGDPAGDTFRKLQDLIENVDSDFQKLMIDSECLDLLDSDRVIADLRPHQLYEQARRLFGGSGMDRLERLGLTATATIGEQQEAAQTLQQSFLSQRWSANSNIRKIVNSAQERLDHILSELMPPAVDW